MSFGPESRGEMMGIAPNLDFTRDTNRISEIPQDAELTQIQQTPIEKIQDSFTPQNGQTITYDQLSKNGLTSSPSPADTVEVGKILMSNREARSKTDTLDPFGRHIAKRGVHGHATNDLEYKDSSPEMSSKHFINTVLIKDTNFVNADESDEGSAEEAA